MAVVVSQAVVAVPVVLAVALEVLQVIALGIHSPSNQSQSRNRRTPRQVHHHRKYHLQHRYMCSHREVGEALAAMVVETEATREVQVVREVMAPLVEDAVKEERFRSL